MAKWGMPVAVLAAVGLIIAFTFYAGPGRPGRGCDQPPWELASTIAAPGEAVLVSADGSTSCNPLYGWQASIEIILYDEYGQPLQTVEAPMTSRGAFSADLVIPGELQPGQYAVSAHPRQRDTCDDTNATTTEEQLVRTSCALIIKTLTITPKR